MTIIESPRDIPRGLYAGYQFGNEQDARAFALKTNAYLYKSHVIAAWYVFVPMEENN